MATTLSTLQAGGTSPIKFVVAIEGCKYLLTDAPTSAALAAWSGTDWTEALGGLFVELSNRQRLDLHDPFCEGGKCIVRVLDQDGSDVFGKYVFRRGGGAETSITATIDRNDTSIPIKYGLGFAASGECYIGTECIGYSGRTSTTITASARGKYSPFAAGGTGSPRFGNHHRVGLDPNHVQLNPIVSAVPRVWVGKRIGIWIHTWDGATMNSRADAQLVFAGRVAELADDANTSETVIECEHILDEVRNQVIGRDLWSGTVAPGIWIPRGRTFAFKDRKTGSAEKTATALTVVASGAAGTNQMNEGFYSLSELCETINRWLGGEFVAGRIYGTYNWVSPVTSNVGLRTKCYWYISHGSSVECSFEIWLPGEIHGFLGLHDLEPGLGQQMFAFSPTPGKRTNVEQRAQGQAVPYTTVIYRPMSPARIAQEFSEAIAYDVEDERGTFTDQRTLLPAAIKDLCPAGYNWGLFLLDEKALMLGSYDGAGRLINVSLAPFQPTGDTVADSSNYIGRRADDPGEPVRVRQIYMFEAPFETIINILFHTTGTSGYNHAIFDTLGYGMGMGIPGELLGENFERSISSLSGASAPCVMRIMEPKKLTELLGADLLVRRAFLRWKNERLEICVWKTPTATESVGTFAESNKAEPASDEANHRVATLETAEFQRPVVKFNYSYDNSTNRDGQFQRSLAAEDQVAVDDSGGGAAKPMTIELKNTLAQFANTGAAIEQLLPDYIAMMPAVSRPARRAKRSMSVHYYEGCSVGDVFVFDDRFARDPLTGARGVLQRPALVIEHGYDIGGATSSAEGDDVRPMSGEVELLLYDFHRGKPYSFAAQVDDTQPNAGYNAGTFTLTFYAHAFSESNAVADASRWLPGANVTICQIDPANPAAPITWQRTIATVVGNAVTFTAGLAAPAWDATKKYVMFSQSWSLSTPPQRDQAYQADDADEMIEDTEVPYHYVASQEDLDFSLLTSGRWRAYTPNGLVEKPAYVADLTFGDGKPQDVASDRAIANMENYFIDYKSAHQAPFLWPVDPEAGTTYPTWTTALIMPMFFGLDHLTTSVNRFASLAPFYRSHNGASASVRMTLSRRMPVGKSGASGLNGEARFIDHFAQATWTTTSTTWQTGAPTAISLGVKELSFGIVWITIEKLGAVETLGPAYIHEGPRIVST